MPIPNPVFLPQPFANNANPQYINTIPNTSIDPGRATYDAGFPPLTMQEKVSGGRPPLGQDFNGILNALSTHIFAQQAGQLYRYSSAVSTAIGGYPVGTVLESTDGITVWFNVLAGNTSNPDANGAGWVPMFNYGHTVKSGLTGGTVTLTRLEARAGVIVLTGTLVSNLQIVLPNTFQNWLIVNATTGAFTTTVRTAAGSGVIVAQGGYGAPVGVYGDGTNIYPTVAPLNLPIDQAATPLTIAQRTNAGYLLATYFNQSSNLENPTIGAVFVQNAAADGFLRKISLLNFLTQIFNNPALTGVATAPTVSISSNSDRIATTSAVYAVTKGYAWTDVSGSRLLDTTYVNSTGRPIQVAVGILLQGVGIVSSAEAFVDGVKVASIGAGVSQNAQLTITFDVPPGSSYIVMNAGGVPTVTFWSELL